MKQEEFFEVIGDIDAQYVKEARGAIQKNNRKNSRHWAVLAACFVLLLALGIPLLNSHSSAQLPLSDASHGVVVSYMDNMDKAPQVSVSYSLLIALSEEELFTHFDTAIFMGTILQIDNIELDFNGAKDYRAIAQIQVEKVYRGDCAVEDTVSVLLPCPIDANIWVEDTETVANMRVGMRGIFMPMVYDDSSIREQNGATLALRDIADYGFADGIRYAFLETEEGLVFARGAYASISDATTLEQVEEYVCSMLNSTQ